MRKLLRIGTDCSGIEAPIQALQQLKVPHVHEWSSEIDKYAIQSICANYSPRQLYGDIAQRNHRDLPDVDVYVCGFPCQPFSTIGKRLGQLDPRSDIMMECVDVIKIKRPMVYVLENVKHFTLIQQGKPYRSLLTALRKISGYTIYDFLLNTKDYGIPQNRERLFIVGFLTSKMKRKFELPRPVATRKLDDFLLDKTKNNDRIGLTSNVLGRLREKGVDVLKIIGQQYVISTNMYIRCVKDLSPTITTEKRHFLVKYNRNMTPVECLMLQGFPRDFKVVVSDTQLTKQAGNSMSVNVLKHLFNTILCTLGMQRATRGCTAMPSP